MQIVVGKEALDEAAKQIVNGQPVAFPTETVYGLGADATNGVAVARIFEMKGRPSFNPLITHILDIENAEVFGILDNNAKTLAEKFWPGPLTLVVPQTEGCIISELVTAGLETIALRAPGNEIARDFLAACGKPLAAPSANLSGLVSPTTADHVAADFHDTDLTIIDGGQTGMGIESTVVSCVNDRVHLLRPGGVTREQLEEVLGLAIDKDGATDENRPQSPGQLTSHYATRAKIRLNAQTVSSEEALLAFGEDYPGEAAITINLSVTGNMAEAAANLFASLRELDKSGMEVIAVSPIPMEGLGVAINDRLQRAAAPR